MLIYYFHDSYCYANPALQKESSKKGNGCNCPTGIGYPLQLAGWIAWGPGWLHNACESLGVDEISKHSESTDNCESEDPYYQSCEVSHEQQKYGTKLSLK